MLGHIYAGLNRWFTLRCHACKMKHEHAHWCPVDKMNHTAKII